MTFVFRKTVQIADVTSTDNENYFTRFHEGELSVLDKQLKVVKTFKGIEGAGFYISPDGRYIIAHRVMNYEPDTLTIMNFDDGRVIVEVRIEDFNIRGLEFSPDSKYVVFYNYKAEYRNMREIYLVRFDRLLANQSHRKVLIGAYPLRGNFFANKLFFSPNGDTLYANEKNVIHGWSLVELEGQLLYAKKPTIELDEKIEIRSIVINPKTLVLYVFYKEERYNVVDEMNDEICFLGELFEGRLSIMRDFGQTYNESSGFVYISPDGHYLIVEYSLVEDDIDIAVYDLTTFELIAQEKKDYFLSFIYWLTNNEPVFVYDIEIKFAVIGTTEIIRQQIVHTEYFDGKMSSEDIFNERLTLEKLKEFAEDIDMPGAKLYDDAVVLRQMLIAFRDGNKEAYPGLFDESKTTYISDWERTVAGVVSKFSDDSVNFEFYAHALARFSAHTLADIARQIGLGGYIGESQQDIIHSILSRRKTQILTAKDREIRKLATR